MIRFPLYWSQVLKITHLQRRIIIYSIMYYVLDESIVSDAHYEEISKQLLGLMKQASTEELKETEFYYCMFDYDGSTGCHLYGRLIPEDREKMLRYAQYTLAWSKGGRSNGSHA